jgi:hypothetical protein
MTESLESPTTTGHPQQHTTNNTQVVHMLKASAAPHAHNFAAANTPANSTIAGSNRPPRYQPAFRLVPCSLQGHVLHTQAVVSV